MFRRFPHEGFCDAQFYNLLDGAVVLSKRYYSCLAEIKPILWNLWASPDFSWKKPKGRF